MIYLIIYPSNHPIIYSPIHLFIYSSIHPTIWSSFHLFIYLYMIIWSSVHIFDHVIICSYIRSCDHLFVCSSDHLFGCSSDHLIFRSSDKLFGYFILSSVRLFICSSFNYSPVNFSICSSVIRLLYYMLICSSFISLSVNFSPNDKIFIRFYSQFLVRFVYLFIFSFSRVNAPCSAGLESI